MYMCVWGGLISGYSDWVRAGRSGIESRWGRDFPPVQTGPWAHPPSCKMGTESFPGVKCGGGVLLTTHPLLVPRLWKCSAIPLPTLWGHTGPVTGTLYLLPFIYIYIFISYIYMYIHIYIYIYTCLLVRRLLLVFHNLYNLWIFDFERDEVTV